MGGRINLKKKIFSYILYIVFIFSVFLIFVLLYYLNSVLGVRNISVNFLEESNEDRDIRDNISELLRKEANTTYKYFLLEQKEISKRLHKDFPLVDSVEINKNINLDISVTVKKNQEFFYTCVGENTNFLVKCMMGNTDGVYFSGLDDLENASTSKKLKIDINPKVLYSVDNEKKLVEPDSLSGARIYNHDDFKKLREIILWVKKNGFEVKKVYVDELKIVDIYTDYYIVKVSLDKGYVDTVRDFETLGKAGGLKKYINEEREKISYIDLSYKNKVFYKLKNNTDNAIMSTTSSSSPF